MTTLDCVEAAGRNSCAPQVGSEPATLALPVQCLCDSHQPKVAVRGKCYTPGAGKGEWGLGQGRADLRRYAKATSQVLKALIRMQDIEEWTTKCRT